MTHTCKAWCTDNEHVTLMYTAGPVSFLLAVGVILLKEEQYVEITRIEPASEEHELPPNRPKGYDNGWLVWYRYLTE